MRELRDKIMEFIETSFDELANADVPFFKQIKAVFKVVSTGIAVIDASHNTAFDNFMKALKYELKALAKSLQSDAELCYYRKLLEKLKTILSDCNQPLMLYAHPDQLETKLRENSIVPKDSTLPKEIAELIQNNIEKLVSPEEWCRGIFEKLTDISEESKNKIESLENKFKWLETVFKREFQEFQQSLVESIEYQGSFQQYLDNKKLPDMYSHSRNRFHYLNKNIRFHGRADELKLVEMFLFSDETIAVWAISGLGGVGKSKFARKICERNPYFYKAVWLEKRDFEAINAITSGYKCDKPILFVCDYADEKEEEIMTLIATMKSAKVRSRFLLLARQSQWYEQLTIHPEINEYNYNPESAEILPLDLSTKPLNKEDFKEILNDFQNSYYPGKSLKEKDYEEIFNLAEIISPKNSYNQEASRCLFILLIADAYLNNQHNICINEERLLHMYFERNIRHIQSNSIDSGLHLLALATALNGLKLSDNNLPSFIVNDIKRIDAEYTNRAEKANFLNAISDGLFDPTNNMLRPFEPDIIGEYLFLWQLFRQINENDQNQWIQYLSDRFDEEDADNPVIETFISRCAADWKELGGKLVELIRGDGK